MEQLRGAVGVVTGGAGGIGLAIVRRLVAEGVRVVVADLDGERASAVAAELRAGGGGEGVEVEGVAVDVRDPDAVEAVAAICVERFGALHLAVNNAGIVNGGRAWELGLDEWRRVLDVDLWGVIHGVRAFVPRILAGGAPGHVVNVASMAAVDVVAGIAPYTVAKHGVLGLSDVLRADLAAVGAPVGVSAVFPGMIRTGMNPIGTVEPEVAAANVVDAVVRDRPYVFTDDHSTRSVRARLSAILAARDDVLPPSASEGHR